MTCPPASHLFSSVLFITHRQRQRLRAGTFSPFPLALPFPFQSLAHPSVLLFNLFLQSNFNRVSRFQTKTHTEHNFLYAQNKIWSGTAMMKLTMTSLALSLSVSPSPCRC